MLDTDAHSFSRRAITYIIVILVIQLLIIEFEVINGGLITRRPVD